MKDTVLGVVPEHVVHPVPPPHPWRVPSVDSARYCAGMSQENVEVVKEWIGAVRDSEDFAWHLLAPDAELINATGAPFTNASGHEGFRAWRAEVSDAFEEWSSHPEQVVDAGNEKVLALGKVSGRGRGTGLQVDMELHSLYTLVDGKISRVEGFFSRHEALEAAGLRE